jgi:hypothetical protein
MIFVALYLGTVALGTLAVVVMTSDRFRDRFTWLVSDDPEELK